MKDGEIKHKLSPAQVSVMQHRVTEPPYFGKYWDHFETGTYRCAACDTPLFSSDEKFDSKTGWPSFKKPLSERDLQFKSEAGPDDKIELRCKKCKSHLGYVIAGDVPYYRINSVCLLFEKSEAPAVVVLDDKKLPDNIPKKEDIADEHEFMLQPDDEPAAWNIPQIAAGLLVGTLIGAGGTAMYLRPHTTPASLETATSTQEIATTTDDSAPGTKTDTAPITPDTSADEPVETPSDTISAPETATSTQ